MSVFERAVRAVGVEAVFNGMTPMQRRRWRYSWRSLARPEQLMPGTPGASDRRERWSTWMVMAGRGFGKTRTGSEAVREEVASGRARAIALVAPTLGDARKLMIEGPSGILATSPPELRPRWIASKRKLTWPNGAEGEVFTSEEPDGLRGREHDLAWCEELGAWKYPDSTWDMMQMTMRKTGPKGHRPRVIVTTTPRAIKLVRRILKAVSTARTGGSTYENQHNLDQDFLGTMRSMYEGTRLGQQELLARLLDDLEGALWKRKQLDALRLQPDEDGRLFMPDLRRIVVAVDPAVSSKPGGALAAKNAARGNNTDDGGSDTSDETGIVVAGLGVDHIGYVLDDVSGIYTPAEWAQEVVNVYEKWEADLVVAEINNGGELVEMNLRTHERGRMLPYLPIHANRGKVTRAEPISGLYEQGKVKHVGMLAKLEDQMCEWVPKLSTDSPDRVDALIYALTNLMLGASAPGYKRPKHVTQRRQ